MDWYSTGALLADWVKALILVVLVFGFAGSAIIVVLCKGSVSGRLSPGLTDRPNEPDDERPRGE